MIEHESWLNRGSTCTAAELIAALGDVPDDCVLLRDTHGGSSIGNLLIFKEANGQWEYRGYVEMGREPHIRLLSEGKEGQ